MKADDELMINHINTVSSLRIDAANDTIKYTGEFKYENIKENWEKIINKGWKIEVIPEYLIEPSLKVNNLHSNGRNNLLGSKL